MLSFSVFNRNRRYCRWCCRAIALVVFLTALLFSFPGSWVIAQVAKKEPAATTPFNTMQMLDNKKRINGGDRISFRVLEDREPPVSINITELGDAEIPYIGRVPAMGKTCKELAFELQRLLEKDYYHQATVIIHLDQSKTRGKVYITGQVRNPGPQEVPDDEFFTVSRAILKAGGLTERADPKVKVVRKDPRNPQNNKVFFVDVRDVFETGDTAKDQFLEANDMIIVSESEIKKRVTGRVYVVGQVKNQGPQDIPTDEEFTVSKAVLKAGGFADFADKRKIKLVRKHTTEEKDDQTIIVDVKAVLEEGKPDKDVVLQANDMVIVPKRLINW